MRAYRDNGRNELSTLELFPENTSSDKHLMANDSSFTRAVPNEEALRDVVSEFAAALEPGDYVTLSGDLGAGKTTFARLLIRELANDDSLEVPSPTFTLLQTYDLPRFALTHADFYRVADADELAELGFDDFLPGAVVLVEWPERAQHILPADRWDIAFALDPNKGPDYRDVSITGHGACAARVGRIVARYHFLDEAGYQNAVAHRLAGDASTRLYQRLQLGEKRLILMDSPRRPDGPPVRDGKSYSAIAHLAEDVKPFIAIANGLRTLGFSAPEILAADLEAGFIVLEDLGSDLVVAGDPPAPIKVRYEAAVHILGALHKLRLPAKLPVAPHVEYRLPTYDMDAFLIEAELLIDWYLPHYGTAPSAAARDEFGALWREALEPVLAQPKTWVLRDFHSPNLLWLPERRGIACLGVIDFQDALLGPAAYDLSSLLQDARVDVPEAMELDLIGRYVRARSIADPHFDVPQFAQVYSTLAAQRASKILGIFTRLDRRDRKPQYLRHLPRVWTYLQRSLRHSALAHLATWYQEHALPPSG
jgi:tRNA threonylcarbamoyl adenosine modification protein YjeE